MFVGDWMNKDVKKNSLLKKYKYIIIFSIMGIILDQIVKLLVQINFNSRSLSKMLMSGGSIGPFKIISGRGIEIIHNFFYITFVKNTGGAWGIFSGNVIWLALISVAVVIVLVLFLRKEKELSKLTITYYSLLFAGIIGNLIDRIINGYVTDFLNFYLFGYDYPVFNIADCFIVIGIMLMFIDVVRGEVNEHKKRKRQHSS